MPREAWKYPGWTPEDREAIKKQQEGIKDGPGWDVLQQGYTSWVYSIHPQPHLNWIPRRLFEQGVLALHELALVP